MSSKDLIAMGLKNLFRRKARTILTILGVVIGTASIIIMLSIGIGMNKSFEENMKQFGSLTTIDVRKDDMGGGGSASSSDPNATTTAPKVKMELNDKAVKLIEGMDGVEAVLAVRQEYGFVKVGHMFANVNFMGVDVSKLKSFDLKPEKGILPVSGSNEVLFGQMMLKQFMNPKLRNPYNSLRTVDIMTAKAEVGFGDMGANNFKPITSKVIASGILPVTNNENDWNAYIDLKSMDKMKSEIARKTKKQQTSTVDPNTGQPMPAPPRVKPEPRKTGYDVLKIKVGDVNKVLPVQEKVKELGFQASSLADGLEYMKKTTAGIRAMLGGIGGVALFVAALGITNTMVMSIYERTREIGVMKVIGAQLGDIKRLFLFEAGIIGFVGGVMGILFSYLVSFILNSTGMSLMGDMYGSGQTASKISVIPLWLVLAALLFSTVVGVAAGYYPALRAMKLSALEAIRNE